MINNFFKVALRNLWRQKSSSAINIIGLSVGLASSLIIFMFVFNELNFDNFHKNARNIYRAYQHSNVGGKESKDAWTPVPMAATLKSDYPEIQNVARLYQSDNIHITSDQKYFTIQHGLYVDSTFFALFSFDLLHGDISSVLNEPHSVVITLSTARKIFGNENPVNKMISFENDTNYFRITGVAQDPPENSHFEFEMLISMDGFWGNKSTDWMSNNMNTYILLPDRFPYHELEKKFPELVTKYFGPQAQKVLGLSVDEVSQIGNELKYKLQPLRDIHLNTSINQGLKPSVNKKYLYIFSLVGIFILILAVINFINLSTARSTVRSRETGLRKVFGSSRKKLIRHFLSESIIISLLSLTIAIFLLKLALPLINKIADLSLSLSSLNSLIMIFLLLWSAILIGILAGFYPAFLLSSFNPISSLKDKLRSGSKGSSVRNILVVVQYFIAIVILSGTLVVYKQLKFIQKKDLGFDKEGIMVVKNAGALSYHLSTFLEEVRKYPGILNASNSTSVPGFPNSDNGFMVEGSNNNNINVLYCTWSDYSFLNAYKLKIVDGRDFMQSFSSDSTAAIINEAAVRKMELKNPVGTRLMRPDGSGNFTYHPIIGVVKDFHFKSLHYAIEPCILLIKDKKFNWPGYISIRLSIGDKAQSIEKINNYWKQLTGNRPLEYTFLDEDLNTLYKAEIRVGNLSATFTVLAILVACLGLFGLISFTTVQRTKEIGVRKIMGASARSILVLLSGETIRLIIISSVLAWPVAYIFLKNWLNGFAFRIDMNPLILILSSIIILGLSLFTIGFQVWFAATRNPVDTLRYE